MVNNQREKKKPLKSQKTKESFESQKTVEVSERLKVLLKKKGLTFNQLAEQLNITSTGLYLSFKRGKVTMLMIERIATILAVHPFYFFEGDIVERMAEEITKHSQKTDLKDFMFGFSRDIAKGMKLEEAVYKNMDKAGHQRSLLL